MNHAGIAGTIVLPGGAGYLGRVLTAHFTRQGYSIVILTRLPHPAHSADAAHPAVRRVFWDGASRGAWTRELEGARAVINLAGRTVNCRYNATNKRGIYASRLLSTQVLGAALAACQHPPPVWINSSSATIYRHALDRPMDEATGEIGSGFSVDVCQQWERALNLTPLPHTRQVALRSAMVFGPGHGGVMEAFERIVRRGLGGTLGRGDQFVSWVHATDFARATQWIMEHETLSGPVNCASPHPVPNAEFMRLFREVCKQPIGLPATAWMLEIGAVFLGTETELLLKSRRVVPGKLLQDGFQFEFPQLRTALEDIIHHKDTKDTKGARRRAKEEPRASASGLCYKLRPGIVGEPRREETVRLLTRAVLPLPLFVKPLCPWCLCGESKSVMDDKFGAFMTVCSLLVANASVAFCGSVITAVSTAYALGLPLFAVSGVDSGIALHSAAAGWRAIGCCMIAVFLLATTLNLMLCSYMVANRPLAQRYALISSVLPTVISGLAGIVVLSH